MNVKISYSLKENVNEAIQDISKQFADIDPRMVIYFASSKFDPENLSQQLQNAFNSAAVFGCSTAGEIVSGKMLKGSVVAMAFSSDAIEDVKVEVVENIKEGNNVEAVFSAFGEYYGTSMDELDFTKYVGIILVDGLSGAEERLMDRIGDLTNVTFVGGSAGDDLKFQKTFVFAGNKAYTNAAILVLIKPGIGFDIIKTQSFCSTDKTLVATKVNVAGREVIEFNNRPASVEYAEAVGTSVDNAPNCFMSHPVGLMFDDEPYVRSPQQIKGERMVFYCNVLEGMELSLLSSTDIVNETKKAIDDKKKELGTISAIINFHCILRTLELESKGITEAYGKLFTDIPTIGFSTYGEEYIGHINQTSTMLVFK
ncbi:FIST C-terminal domain-containing protein [bacterium]|nr:FIST C-terminal domain-containing protein [bacterium]